MAQRVHVNAVADSAIADAVNIVLGTNLVFFFLLSILGNLGRGNSSDLPRLSYGFWRFLRRTGSDPEDCAEHNTQEHPQKTRPAQKKPNNRFRREERVWKDDVP